MRWAQVIFFKKVHVAEILSALGFTKEAKLAVGPTGEGWSSATKVEQCLSGGSRQRRMPSRQRSALVQTRMIVWQQRALMSYAC